MRECVYLLWCRGSIPACHACGLGSNSGERTLLSFKIELDSWGNITWLDTHDPMRQDSVLYLDDFLTFDGLGMSFDDVYLGGEHVQQSVAEDVHLPDGGNSYRPKKIRGTGSLREGYCCECNTWLRLKTSSYWYHMNYKHGINSRGVRYPEPQTRCLGTRVEGFCNMCSDWIFLGHRNKGKSILFGWFKHWQKNHTNK